MMLLLALIKFYLGLKIEAFNGCVSFNSSAQVQLMVYILGIGIAPCFIPLWAVHGPSYAVFRDTANSLSHNTMKETSRFQTRTQHNERYHF